MARPRRSIMLQLPWWTRRRLSGIRVDVLAPLIEEAARGRKRRPPSRESTSAPARVASSRASASSATSVVPSRALASGTRRTRPVQAPSLREERQARRRHAEHGWRLAMRVADQVQSAHDGDQGTLRHLGQPDRHDLIGDPRPVEAAAQRAEWQAATISAPCCACCMDPHASKPQNRQASDGAGGPARSEMRDGKRGSSVIGYRPFQESLPPGPGTGTAPGERRLGRPGWDQGANFTWAGCC